MDSRDGNHEVYYKHSSDKGDNWGTDTRLTFFTGDSFSPSVAASDSTVHIVWGDNRYLISEVYYRQSLDNGTTWEPEIRLSENDGFSSANPTVTDSGLNVYVVWEDVRDTNPEIYYKHSPDNGTSWETDTRLTNHSSNKNSPSVAVSGTNIHIIWADSRDGNAEIYYKCSVDGGTSWQSDTRLTNFDGSSQYPSIALSGTVVHIVWYDDRDANTEIYYKRNPTGNPTGIININSETLAEFKLYQNYPNPFNPSTKISWQAPVGSHQVLKVFDILGNEVATLVDEYKEAGNYEVDFNAASLSSGVYFYRLNTGDYVKTMKMVLLK
ncbi:MAG: T9SS type A sorting domain-containing protein [Ignavibacteriaceae bacterium]|nr:T9SS type A sorting domain-containing protein [Ignavibacteriaceae bacterium]